MSFYETISQEAEIEQGDIFLSLPFLRLESSKVIELKVQADQLNPIPIERELLEMSPNSQSEYSNIISKVIFRPAIIISQSCDSLRDQFISYCEVLPFNDFEKEYALKTSTKEKVKFLTKHLKEKEKYFYLPIDTKVSISEQKAVDFSSIHQINRNLLNTLKESRLCRLGNIPAEHFRKKISHYFSRFAYDPWYPLTKEEYILYKESQSEDEQKRIPPFDWQV